jgi:hypothetical protein
MGVTSREEQKLKVSENRPLIITPKPKEGRNTTTDTVVQPYQIPHNLYCSPNYAKAMKSNRMRWAEHIACLEILTYLLEELSPS